jgi:hypothetical protein
MSGQKDLKATGWLTSSEGRKYRHLDIEGERPSPRAVGELTDFLSQA